MSQDSARLDESDLSQFHGVFFDEAGEHLGGMEALLVDIDIDAPDAEQVNAIFRAAHSIKGGAATFGFRDITELTHEMETVFDRVRKAQMDLTTDLVDAFLASGDMLKAMLAARRDSTPGVEAADVASLCARLRAFLAPGAAPVASAPVANVAAPPKPATRNVLEITFGPFDALFTAASLDGVIADLRGFGEIEELEPSPAAPPPATGESAKVRGKTGKDSKGAKAAKARTTKAGKPGKSVAVPTGPQERRFRLVTDLGAEDMADTLAFMVSSDNLKVRLLESLESPAPAPVAVQAPVEDAGFGLFVDPATLPAANLAGADPAKPAETSPKVVDLKSAAAKPAAAADAASIRVSVEKVDQLINMVGELVITQAMLAQTASKVDPVVHEALFNGLALLERNTRDLQEAAMSIRMMPMSFAFSRFPRVVRDLAAKLGKEVELHTVGEATELDKGLIERIVDPLTHLVRNSLDHGIELPAERVAKGKLARGSITLRAYHHGGAIIIEVSDDGAGLDRGRLIAKARERGMKVADDMGDSEVWGLIFEPGFSTAKEVTDVSGRGVGMDVVRRNIKELGGRVEIESSLGIGTRITIRLPLTLAILDGMSVRVGQEIFIIPLTYIVESLQPAPGSIGTLAGRDRVIAVRGEYLPVVALHEVMGTAPGEADARDGIVVILEAEGGKTALLVDALVGQYQVVIKSLETNFRKIPGISGATIMGDGRVAMILDVSHVVARASSRLAKAA